MVLCVGSVDLLVTVSLYSSIYPSVHFLSIGLPVFAHGTTHQAILLPLLPPSLPPSPSLPSLTYFLLSIHLFIQPSHLYTHLHIHPFIHPPVCPFSHLSVHLFTHLPIYPRLWAFAEKLARLRKQGHRLGFIGHNLATRGGALGGPWVGMGM